MPLLKQNIIKREQVEKRPEFYAGNDNNKEYKVEAIWNSAVYANKSKSGHLPGFDCLVMWKGFPKEENT